MYTVLVVDDEKKIRKVISEYIKFSGNEIIEAEDGMEAINICKTKKIDAVVMDIMMPKLDGYSAVKEIKKIKDIPIIILSARGEEYDKLYGFEIGIDDYVVKPFSPKELIARLNVVIERNKNKNHIIKNKFKYKDFEIDLDARTVSIDNKRIDLTPKEFELLSYLVKNKNIALSRKKILDSVWDYDFYGDERTVDTHIKMLRNNLGDKLRDSIVTVRGVGYKFEVDEDEK